MVKKIKIRSVSPEVQSAYDLFVGKPHSKHIATPISIEALFTILKREKPRKILEVGGGIGTLSYLILKNTDVQLDVFEDLPICIKALKENLSSLGCDYNLVTTYEGFAAQQKEYDLVVVDGGTEKFLREMVQSLDRIGTIYIDGSREKQRRAMRRELRKRYTFCITQYVDAEKKQKGGFAIKCRLSGNPLLRRLSYWYWESVLAIRPRIRNILKRIFKNHSFDDYQK